MERTVLIIDDSDDDTLLTQMVLTKMGFRSESALSGAQGLARLRNGAPLPSLILLDLKMPGMDGFDVLCEIRGDDRLRAIPVVVVTHSDLQSDKDACFNVGANSFLQKTVDLDRFAAELRKELDRWMKE